LKKFCKIDNCNSRRLQAGLCYRHLKIQRPEILRHIRDKKNELERNKRANDPEWDEKNRLQNLEKNRRYRLRHREEPEYKERNRLSKAKSFRKIYPTLKTKVIDHYSNGINKCMCPGCDESRLPFLTIDHVNGGGTLHKKSLKTNLYRYLVANNFPSDIPLQVMCFNCNQAKSNRGKCPVHEGSSMTG
jgi:hypothetical protein